MSGTDEVKELHLLIEQDEQTLALRGKAEEEVVEHIARQGFQAASRRERMISERQAVTDRLHKNRRRLAAILER